MSGIGEVASIIAVLQLADRIFAICSEYFSAVKDARRDVQRLQHEVLAFRDALASISDSLETAPEKRMTALRKLRGSGLLNECYVELEDVAHALDNNKGMQRFGLKALKWPFTSKRLDETVEVLQRYKSSIILAMESDQTAASSDMETYWRRHYILSWLSTVDPSTNHAAAFDVKHSNTGGWFLDSQEFQNWKRIDNSFLWMTGIPGSGKTVLCSAAIEHLKTADNSQDSAPLAYFYFDFNDASKQDPLNFVSSLCSQLCHWLRPLSADVEKVFHDCHDGRQQATMTQLLALLKKILKSLGESYVIVDAIDECPADDSRVAVMDILTKLASIRNCKLHILASSRREGDIERSMASIHHTMEVSLEKEATITDIGIFVRDKIDHDSKLNRWPLEVRREIQRELIANSRGMFRWVVCQFDLLKACLNEASIRQTLMTLPHSLHGTYERMLCQIPEEYQQLLKRALTWLALANRPLYVEELAEAIVINVDAGTAFTRQLRLHDPWYVLDILGSLVNFTESSKIHEISDCGFFDEKDVQKHSYGIWDLEEALSYYGDKRLRSNFNNQKWRRGTTLITLAHASVRDFLLSQRSRSGNAAVFAVDRDSGHELISRSCLCYLACLDKVPEIKYEQTYMASHAQRSKYYARWPLLHYAGDCWFVHSRSIKATLSSALIGDMIDLLLTDTALEAWAETRASNLGAFKRSNHTFVQGSSDFEVEFAVHIIAQALTKEGPTEYTSRSWPEMLCRYSLAKENLRTILLERCRRGRHRNEGGAAVFAAAWVGDLELLRLLVWSGLNTELEFNPGMRAAHAAAARGQVKSLELLLSEAHNLEVSNGNGETPLFIAAKYGQEPAIKYLLGLGANVNTANSQQWTALYVAAEQRRTNVVKLLLQKGADRNLRTDSGMTPFDAAAMYGNTTLVTELFQDDENAGKLSQNGWSIIHFVAQRGHADVLQLLKRRINDIDVRTRDGKTALHIAVESGNENAARKLVDLGANINAQDNAGETPIFCAVRHARLTTVKLLVEHGATLDQPNVYGDTVLQVACDWAGDEYVRLFLSKGLKAKDVNIVAFARCGDVVTIELLLAHGANRQQRGRNYNRIALHWAAIQGDIRLVQLLAIDRSDYEYEDDFGNRPIFYARQEGHKAVARQLESIKSIAPEPQNDTKGHAVQEGELNEAKVSDRDNDRHDDDSADEFEDALESQPLHEDSGPVTRRLLWFPK